MKKIILIIISFLLVSCMNFQKMWNRYYNNLAETRVSENDFNLTEYQPFIENNKLATLDTLSALKINKKFPVLDGATALYPLYAAFAQAVYLSKSKKNVKYSNTMNAFKYLINRKVDIIFVACPSKEQFEMAEKVNVKLKLTPIAKEAFVFFVNKTNSVNNLSISQLQDIYSRKIKNWNEVGGQNDTIIPFQRNVGSGSQTAFLNFMSGKEIIQPKKDEIIWGMGMIISQVADYINYKNSIGFSFRFFTNEIVDNQQIKLLKINGVYPEIETIKNNSYPLSSNFYAITLSDNQNPNVEKFLEWILSEQGQKLVEKTGYCPF